MKTIKEKMSSQVRFTLTLNATWAVLRDPVLTKLYSRLWKRYVNRCTNLLTIGKKPLSLYGYIFKELYREV